MSHPVKPGAQARPGLRFHSARLWLLTALHLFPFGHAGAAKPIQLHPENRHYFEFQGKATILVGSSEHYGALLNLDFNYLQYLDEVRACGLNLVRIFSGTYYEAPGAFTIEDNTLAPFPGRYQGPWARSQTPGASDGGNKFDLEQWDPAYFHRLREFVRAAAERDIVVEFTLFCPYYDVYPTNESPMWDNSPMNAANNVNGVGTGTNDSAHRLDSDLLPFQKALTLKCAKELATFENVFFEIINEPYQGDVPIDWQEAITDELVAAEASLPTPHLIAQNIANVEGIISNPNPAISIFNFHYAQPQAALLNQGLNVVIGDDETGFANNVDLPYRIEAWEFMLAGGGLIDHLDFNFTPEREDGMASPNGPGGGGPAIRRQLGILRWFLEALPLVDCSPQTGFITDGVPPDSFVQVLGSPGEAYGLYLRGGTQANLSADLPTGTYCGRWIDPRSGEIKEEISEFTHTGGSFILVSPGYDEDIALHLFESSVQPPVVTLTEPAYQTVASANSTITLKADASVENGTLTGVEFLEGNTVLGFDTSAPYELTLSSPQEGSKIFRARATTSDGREASSQPVKCRLMGPFHTGVNLNGDSVSLNAQLWLSETDATLSGLQLTNSSATNTSPSQAFYPAPDPQTKVLVASQVVGPESTTTHLWLSYPAPNGTYDVFFTLVEGESAYNRDVNATIEGVLVATGIGDLALGEWVNYGPYRTSIQDGQLNIDLVANTIDPKKIGGPKIANFSLYAAEPSVALEDAEMTLTGGIDVAVLSLPSNIPISQVETSTTLSPDSWAPYDAPAADFGSLQEITAPTHEPARFFRLRKD